MIPVVYFSNVTENTHRFIQRLSAHSATPAGFVAHRLPVKRTEEVMIMDEDYILICPSYGTERTNHVPPQVKHFLSEEANRNLCVGVIGAGNINFGEEYAVSADAISRKLQVPILHKFELSGFDRDISALQQIIQLTPADVLDRTAQLANLRN